jgi:hypothetical protein
MIDLTNKKIGRLTVLTPDPLRKGYWYCRCDCGKLKSIRGSNLAYKGHVISCGCAKRENKPFHDYTGERFGKLLVISYAGDKQGKSQKERLWLIRCDCGNEIIRPSTAFHHQKSCGCTIKTQGGYSNKYKRFYAFTRKLRKLDPEIGSTIEIANALLFKHLAFSNGHNRTYPALKNRNLPLTLDNIIFTDKHSKSLYGRKTNPTNQVGIFVTVNGEKGNLSYWAKKLSLTRERARQLHKLNRLEERIYANQ